MKKFNLKNHIKKFEKQAPNIPISSYEEHLKNKNINYNMYLKFLFFSNFDTKREILEIAELKRKEKNRFLYRNKLTSDIEATERFFNRSMKTIDTNIKTREQIGLIEKIRVKDRLVYIVYYSTNNRKFVKLKAKIVIQLLDCDSNTIKIYILLKYMCGNEEKQITRKYITEQIGLSSKSKKTLQNISNSLSKLEQKGLISIRTVSDGKKKYNYYRII